MKKPTRIKVGVNQAFINLFCAIVDSSRGIHAGTAIALNRVRTHTRYKVGVEAR